MESRRSCRSFSDRPVPREVIEAAIRAAASAPSGGNRQPWHFVAISGEEAKCAIRIALEEEERAFYGKALDRNWRRMLGAIGTGPDKPFLEIAPWLIVVFADRKGAVDTTGMDQAFYVSESVAIATGLMLATLHEAGIATLLQTPRAELFLTRLCRRPSSERPFLIVVAGHPADDATIPEAVLERRPMERIATWL